MTPKMCSALGTFAIDMNARLAYNSSEKQLHHIMISSFAYDKSLHA